MSTPSFAAPSPVSLVVAGAAPISFRHTAALLEDWLRTDTGDPVDTQIFLPATGEAYSPVVDAVGRWAIARGYDYGVVVDGDGAATPCADLVAKAQFRVDAQECGLTVAAALTALLVEDNAAARPRMPYLIVAWGTQPEAPDSFTDALVAAAEEAGIPILEIAATGLQEFLAPAEDEEEETAAPQDDQDAATADERAADEGQALASAEMPTDDRTAERQDEHVLQNAETDVWDLVGTLGRAWEFLWLREAACNVFESRPLPEGKIVRSLRHHYNVALNSSPADALQKPPMTGDRPGTPTVEITTVTPVTTPGEPERPARKGRSRAAAGEVAVFVNPATQEMVIAKGRPKAGWVRQFVKESDLPQGLLNAA